MVFTGSRYPKNVIFLLIKILFTTPYFIQINVFSYGSTSLNCKLIQDRNCVILICGFLALSTLLGTKHVFNTYLCKTKRKDGRGKKKEERKEKGRRKGRRKEWKEKELNTR